MSSSTLNNINSNGVSLRLNPNTTQNIELGNGGGNVLVSNILSSSSSTNSTSVTTGSINTLGGLGVSLDTVIGGHLYIGQTGITGERTLLIENDSSNSAAFAALRLTNNTASGLVAFINSSTKTTDGGVNNATIRNDAGALNLQGSGGTGLNISTAGVINIGNLTASRAVFTDSSSNLVSINVTGSGDVVRATGPTLVTPVLGAATGTSLSVTGMLTNGGFDFYLGNTDQATRGNSGTSRAMVKDVGNILYVNYESDYTGGTRLGGPVILSGNRSGASSDTLGQYLRLTGGTYTDTGVAGTRTTSLLNSIGAPVLASTNAVTVTNAINLRIAGGPTAGTNTTITNSFGLWNEGRTRLVGRTEITDTTDSTSSSTGALVVSGGISISDTAEATSVTNGGSFTTAGGMAIAKKLFVDSLTASQAVFTHTDKSLISVDVTGTGNVVLSTSTTGTGNVVRETSPTLVTPVLGAASGTSLNLSSLTASLPVVTDASKNLISATVTGTGTTVVLANAPTLVTPVLGVASATSIATTTATVNDYYEVTNVTAPGSATAGKQRFYVDTSDSLFKSKNSSGTITTYQPITTKGDLVSHNGTTQTRVPVGTNGQILVADSTQASGLIWGTGSTISHGALSGLASDNHTQYALLAGRSGGQILTGGTAASNNLTLRSTTDLTKGSVIIDEATASTSNATGALRLAGGIGISNATNATSVTNGGSFTTAGGMSVAQRLFVGGPIMIGTSTDTGRIISALNSAQSASTISYITFGQANTANNQAELGFSYVTSGNTTNALTFGLHTGGERMRIRADGNVGINTATPGYVLDVNGTIGSSGIMTLTGTTSIGNSNAITTGTSGVLNTQGDITLYNGTKNTIAFRGVGVGAPTVTSRSAGTKIVLFPDLSGTTVDYGIGIETNSVWYSAGPTNGNHKFYSGSSNVVTIGSAATTMTYPAASTSNATGALQLLGGIGINNTTDANSIIDGGTFTTAGGMAVAKKLFVGGNLHTGVDNPVDAPRELFVYNTSTGNSAYSNIKLINNTTALSIFMNGSGRSDDGGANNATIKNEGGRLNLLTSTGNGIIIDEDGTVRVQDTPFAVNGGRSGISSETLGSYLLVSAGGTFTDTGSSRTITRSVINTIGSAGLASTSTVTVTNAVSLFIAGGPVPSGGNTTITNSYGLWNEGRTMLTNRTEITDGTNSTSPSIGALVVAGGISISETTDAATQANGGSFTTAGGMGVGQSLLVGGKMHIGVGTTTAGPRELFIYNQLNSSAAYSIIKLITNAAGSLNIIMNSTTRTGDGAGNAATIHNEAGMLRLISNGGLGLTIAATTGVVSGSSTTQSTSNSTGALVLLGGIGISHTTDASSSTVGGSFTTAGGMAVAKKLFVGDQITAQSLVVSGGSFTSGAVNARFDDFGLTVSDSGTKTVVASFSGYTVATGYYSTSDIRIKENIQTICNSSLEDIRPVTYDYIDKQRSAKKQYGFIAQEVEEIYPHTVVKEHTYIPNIMKKAYKTGIKKFRLDHDVDVGKELCIYITHKDTKDDKEKQFKCKILNKVNNEYTINIDFDKIFVYGTYEDDVRSIKYENFIPLLVADNQKKTKQINELQTQLDNLKAKVDLLMQKI